MFFIILGIVIAIILFSAFAHPNEKSESSNIDWWTIGMIADLHNKINNKDKR